MFDTLTPAERLALRAKLATGAHKFAEVGHALANVALADSSNIIATVWDQSERYYAAMDEIYGLRLEVAA